MKSEFEDFKQIWNQFLNRPTSTMPTSIASVLACAVTRSRLVLTYLEPCCAGELSRAWFVSRSLRASFPTTTTVAATLAWAPTCVRELAGLTPATMARLEIATHRTSFRHVGFRNHSGCGHVPMEPYNRYRSVLDRPTINSQDRRDKSRKAPKISRVSNHSRHGSHRSVVRSVRSLTHTNARTDAGIRRTRSPFLCMKVHKCNTHIRTVRHALLRWGRIFVPAQ